MIFEICTDLYGHAELAKKYTIKRIELCSALSLGGLTPSVPLAKMFASKDSFETHVMIRPRDGDFCYTDFEIEIMTNEIELMAKQGINGVVFGCLTKENQIDTLNTSKLVDVAKKYMLEVTFHRAFDYTNRPIEALEKLIDLKINRLLTSGLKKNAIDGIAMIKDLVIKSKQRIQIMAGSGVHQNNAKVLAETGIDALHFSSHKTLENSDFSMGSSKIPDEEKIASIVNLFR